MASALFWLVVALALAGGAVHHLRVTERLDRIARAQGLEKRRRVAPASG